MVQWRLLVELATQSTSNPILFKPNNTERVRVQDGGWET